MKKIIKYSFIFLGANILLGLICALVEKELASIFFLPILISIPLILSPFLFIDLIKELLSPTSYPLDDITQYLLLSVTSIILGVVKRRVNWGKVFLVIGLVSWIFLNVVRLGQAV